MDPKRIARLTEQQRACLRHVYAHLTSKEIAPIMGIEPGSVDQSVVSNAVRAAPMARSMSAAEPSAATPMTSSVADSITSIVPDELLTPANALETTSFNSALIVGPALAGTLSAAFDPAVSLIVEAALALLALALILRIPGLDRRPRPREARRTLLGVAADGIRQLVAVAAQRPRTASIQ